MKTRNGFVSNSSSSSYVVFIDRPNVFRCPELKSWLEKNKFEDHELWTLMEGGPDGDWFRCKVTKKILKILLDYWDKSEDIIILVDPIWKDDDDYGFLFCATATGTPIDESLVGKEYEVVDVDYHGPKTTYDWLYHFGRYTHEEYWNGGLFKKEDTDDEEDVVEN